MNTDVLGEVFALLAAITWAIALVLFKRSGESVPPLALNLFKNVIGLILLGVTLLALGEGWSTLAPFSREDIYVLIISGVVGIALADTLFFHALNLVGVGIISIVDCLYSPFAILFAYLMLSETLTVYHYLGGALILGGVFLSSGHGPPANRTRGQILLGVVLGMLAMAMVTAGIVYAKPVLEAQDFPLVWATMIRLIFGTLALAAIALASAHRRTHWSAFRPSRVWRISVPASVLGTYLSMIFWVGGFKYAEASIAAILNQTSVIFALILATWILKEAFTRRKLVAVILALGGALVMLHEELADVLT